MVAGMGFACVGFTSLETGRMLEIVPAIEES
jgi:hypothetical protein